MKMSKTTPAQPARFGGAAPKRALCAAAIAVFAVPPAAHAVPIGDGEGEITIDTTISHGVAYRVGDRDESVLGINSDDGDRNYDRGLISNTSRIISEIDVDAGAVGAFARVQGFIDFANRDGEGDYMPLPDESRRLVSDDVELLDFYLSGQFDAGEIPIDARLGNQVLNWGESTFIQGGINVINPFDITKLRKPGAELREGLQPVPIASVSVAATPEISVEGFYQFRWAETEIDPSGSYFSTNDYATPGGSRVFISDPRLGPVSDQGGSLPVPPQLLGAINADLAGFQVPHPAQPGAFVPAPQPAQPAFDRNYLSVPRLPDRDPANSGQGGIAVRYFSEALNDTEFGFYFVKHHSRLPLLSARFGTVQGYQAGLAAAGAVAAATSKTAMAIAAAVTEQVAPVVAPLVVEAATPMVRAAVLEETKRAIIGGLPAGTPAAQISAIVEQKLRSPMVQQQMATAIQTEVKNQVAAEVGNRVRPIVTEQLTGLASLLAIDRYGRTARYFVEYPEDLKMFGFSFNTLLGGSGWALQGEYSFHPDTPVQRAEADVIAEGLAPLTDYLEAGATGVNPLAARLGTYLPGYITRDVSQLQATATRFFDPVLGADSLVFVTEAALAHVHDMPNPDDLPLNTLGSGGIHADETAFGYRMAARLDFNNAIGAARLSPYAQFQHDVSGSGPAPGSPFVEGRTVLTLGLGLSYLDSLRADVSYTRYAGDNNYLSGRDFIALSAGYSF